MAQSIGANQFSLVLCLHSVWCHALRTWVDCYQTRTVHAAANSVKWAKVSPIWKYFTLATPTSLTAACKISLLFCLTKLGNSFLSQAWCCLEKRMIPVSSTQWGIQSIRQFSTGNFILFIYLFIYFLYQMGNRYRQILNPKYQNWYRRRKRRIGASLENNSGGCSVAALRRRCVLAFRTSIATCDWQKAVLVLPEFVCFAQCFDTV